MFAFLNDVRERDLDSTEEASTGKWSSLVVDRDFNMVVVMVVSHFVVVIKVEFLVPDRVKSFGHGSCFAQLVEKIYFYERTC